MIIKGKKYNIDCDLSIPETATTVVIALHGFAGDKKSGCILALKDRIVPQGVGLITFDWPGHGESEVGGEYLTVENCLDDLDTIYHYINQNYPTVKSILTFATSFGGYLALLYHHQHPSAFQHVILRAPAIRMGTVLEKNIMTPAMRHELEEKGYFDFGYERVMKVTKTFLEEVLKNDVVALYKNEVCHNIDIIHGTIDDFVPIEDSIEFCKEHQIRLHKIVGADHRFKGPGQIEEVIQIADEIIKKVLVENKS